MKHDSCSYKGCMSRAAERMSTSVPMDELRIPTYFIAFDNFCSRTDTKIKKSLFHKLDLRFTDETKMKCNPTERVYANTRFSSSSTISEAS